MLGLGKCYIITQVYRAALREQYWPNIFTQDIVNIQQT